MARNGIFTGKAKSATLVISTDCGYVWWTIRGSNTVDIFKQISEIVEKKGVGIVYRVYIIQNVIETVPNSK